MPAAGIEYYLPLFFDSLATVFDYLPAAVTVVLHHQISDAIQDFWRDASSRYKLAGGDPDRPLLPPPQLFVPAEEFYLRVQAFPRIDIVEQAEKGGTACRRGAAPVAVDRRADDPLAR